MRITPTMVRSVFKIYCELHGFPLMTAERKPGSYFLDYNACYGGWRVSQLLESTGERDVHLERYSTKEMYHLLAFANRTKQETEFRKREL